MVDLVQRHLEAIYAIEGPDVRDFLVDDAALAEILGEQARPSREWVLVRECDDGLDLAVWIQDADLRAVEDRTPADAVRDALPAFCAITEGVSHFLLLVRRAAREETVSLLELETQAEVDKYVTARLHVGPDPTLRKRIFGDVRLADGLTAEECERYTEAGRLAERYCTRLERLRDVASLLAELRAFYRLPGHARMDRLRRAA